MIELNNQLCEELDLTYWQLNQASSKKQPQHAINREEKELLKKILLTKGISLNDEILEVQENGVVVVSVNSNKLIFNDVNSKDSGNITNLAKISDMLDSVEYKKLTWHKLKNLDL